MVYEVKAYNTTGDDTSPTETETLYWNLMSVDAADTDDTLFEDNEVIAPISGETSYSFEKWGYFKFEGTFNSITNCEFHMSSGLGTDYITVNAGVADDDAYTTPVDTVSSVATSEVPGPADPALDIQNGTMDTDGDITKYVVLQAVLTHQVNFGDMIPGNWKLEYDIS